MHQANLETTFFRVAPPVLEGFRLTIPAREALERAGATIVPAAQRWHQHPTHQLLDITMPRPPAGLVRCLVGQGQEQHNALRMENEPEYPGEWSQAGGAVAWHERGELVPCPRRRCGASLVWFEAGYVPGRRICVNGHHVQLSADGRSARAV